MRPTATRVKKMTAPAANRKIAQRTEARLAGTAEAGREAVERRLAELEREWDIERALETNGSTLLLAGLALGAFVDRRFLALPALVGAFCLQHALQGWCPPLEAFRRMGVRTAREIEEERTALKALRGDFRAVSEGGPAAPAEALRAARRN